MASDKYLLRHAEPEAALSDGLSGPWHFALVIPAYRESVDFLKQARPDNCLLILVLNRPDTDPDTDWAEQLMESLGETTWRNEHLSYYPQDNLLLVDRCLHGPPVPAKQGVGLARKIGADIACHLYARKAVASPWIACSDADAQLPSDYGLALSALPLSAAACVFPFQHQPHDLPEWVVACYELHMLYYVAGLRYAGSIYAWPTIGSCLAVHAGAYTQAHGFPKRAGGEDFYLLNKLAKLGGVLHASTPQIAVAGRRSNRVPFGTGPALEKIAALDSSENYLSYHPHSFNLLKAALAGLETAATVETPDLNLIAHKTRVNADEFKALWQRFDCPAAIARAHRNSNQARQRRHHLLTWFDAFRTLKWIHACRERHPDSPLLNSLRNCPWLPCTSGANETCAEQAQNLQQSLSDNRVRGLSRI